MSKSRLEGKVAIVTGGSRGIGAAIAMEFARNGAKVVITSRGQDGLDQVATQIEGECPGAVRTRTCHVGKADQLRALVDFTERELGVPNILVNNAATNPYFGPLLQISDILWDKTFEVNLRGPFNATRLVCQRLLEKELPGSIINIASVAGMRAAPLQAVYAMTKASMISMTQTLAIELGASHIRVNVIAPGLVDTRLAKILVDNPDLSRIFTDHTALKRYAQPEEIAGMAVYLASDESSYVTGQTLCVDGGYTIC